MPELWFQESTQTVWVYRTKCGKFYKNHTKGSWAVSMNGVSKKDITVGNLSGATKFTEMPDTVPYCHPSMHGGRYIQIKITTKYEVIK
ncbi:hypothetical protein VPHD81_0101 [Vibrio phage D81]